METYEEICFKLNEAYKQLASLDLGTFILSPEIKELTSEIQRLTNAKKQMEDLANEGKEN